MKRRIQAADSIRFCVRGRGAQRLLGQAAQAGLKLERIAPQADGFTAVVSGAGWAKLCQLARCGGWQVIQMQRRGPGPLAERLLRRPGILAGIGLFFVLLHWLGGFLWLHGSGTFDRSPTGKHPHTAGAERHLGGLPPQPGGAGPGAAAVGSQR